MPAESLRIYNLFPLLVGPVARWRAELPRIAALGFNAVFVNPFHYPGFSGSLYAVKDYYLLNPLFRGDAPEPDDALLAGFAGDCRRHRVIAMMDLVVNHTARDSELVTRHPHWFAREPGGGVRSPSAIDPADAAKVTVWGDLAEIEYRGDSAEAETVAYFQDVVRHYAGLGFRGFRCDAAYKVPARVWQALIGAARATGPDSVFCAETLGARLEEVRRLDGAGFDYLFNSAKWWDFESPWLLEQYDMFRAIAPSIAFTESHDTERLAAELERAGVTDAALIEARYRQAYAFAACFSAGLMMPMGYEFGWGRRLDVARTRPIPAEPKRFDLSPYIAAVNAMKRDTPALNEEGPQQRLTPPSDPVAVLARRTQAGDEWAFTLVNTDDEVAQEIELDALLAAVDGQGLVLDDATPGSTERGVDLRLVVDPAEVRVLRGRGAVRPALPVASERTRPAGGMRPDWSPTARILIEEVYPELDGGRFPVKRTVGDTFAVWADILRDGHDVLRAALLYRPERASDRCSRIRATATPSRPGRTISLPGAPTRSRSGMRSKRSPSSSSKAARWWQRRRSGRPGPTARCSSASCASSTAAIPLPAPSSCCRGSSTRRWRAGPTAATRRATVMSWRWWSTARVPASAPGTRCSCAARAACPGRPAPSTTASPACRRSRRWASTSSTCRPSTRSGASTARAATTA